MTIANTAYDTSACNGFVLNRTLDALKAANINGWVERIPSTKVAQITGREELGDSVKPFAHPMLLDGTLYIDVRSFSTWDNAQHAMRIRNGIEHGFAVRRAELNQIWLDQNKNILRDISPLPMSVFASWISESVARRFALDPREQLDLCILAAVWYNSQFQETGSLDETGKLRAVNAISKSLRVSASDVLAIMDQVSEIDNTDHFCSLAESVTKSIRLRELNRGLLFAVVAGTWFGTNSKEVITTALEHPPTWIAILTMAFTERTYKNSNLAKIAERSVRAGGGDEFLRAVLNLLAIFKD